ncbi:hypothetical protein EDB81DRAFT_761788 [Dactylonectria macrodidyma]|uniref:Uncharacterized protein n=1 Tax=Dactylonectria macrodidyma TaxID=307937 RepID=A0A9P9IW50_9HYPO|nr:hypothetical protein EDB81DRAFT_761788 [Dactylonectria macrodidyma]
MPWPWCVSAILALHLLCVSNVDAHGLAAASQEARHDASVARTDLSLRLRALPDSPSGDYSPKIVDCPRKRPVIRTADTLSEDEASWVFIRRNNTISPLRALLERADIPGFDAKSYMTIFAITPPPSPTLASPSLGAAIVPS